MSKEEWFKHFERNLNNGIPYEQASEKARQDQIDEMADRIDQARLKKKEEPNEVLAPDTKSF